MQGNFCETKRHSVSLCKFFIDGVLLAVCGFVVIAVIVIVLMRRRKYKRIRTPSPVLYYLAKTSFNEDHRDFCKTLIEREKYDVNYFDPEEKLSLFLCACLSGNPDIVSFMIKKGADVRSISHYGDTALYLAVYGYLNSCAPDLKVLSILLSAGADPSIPNNEGELPVDIAYAEGFKEIAQCLMRPGEHVSTNVCV